MQPYGEHWDNGKEREPNAHSIIPREHQHHPLKLLLKNHQGCVASLPSIPRPRLLSTSSIPDFGRRKGVEGCLPKKQVQQAKYRLKQPRRRVGNRLSRNNGLCDFHCISPSGLDTR